MIKEILNKFHKKLWREAIIKSIIYGSIIGFMIALIFAIIFYVLVIDGLWIILLTWLGMAILSAYLFKQLYFKSSLKLTAKRMDQQLNLKERVLTMVEYEDSDKVIIQKQRENAEEHIHHFSPKQLKIINLVRPVVILLIIGILAITMTIFTESKVSAAQDGPQITEPEPLSPDDEVIDELINELRAIVDEADISSELKLLLHEIIDQLVIDLSFDETIPQKIARIENTRREILEIIADALKEKSTIIDELISHDSTNGLGLAFESEDETIITDTIEQIVTDFIAMSVEEMKSYLTVLSDDIEQSVIDADIKDEALEAELEELIRRLRELIPIIEGDRPDEFGNDLQEILEELSEALSPTDESDVAEDIDDAIQDAIDSLDDMENPDQPDKPDEPVDGNGEEDDGNGEGQPIENPVIIDGETEFSYELFQQIQAEYADMIQNNEITDEELLALINAYIDNVEQAEPTS